MPPPDPLTADAWDASRPRVVVRGAGSIGRRHATVFRGLGAQVKVWPVRPRPAERLDRETGVALLADDSGPAAYGQADLVVIATDTARHVADAVLALDAGAARVLVEKPLAPTLADVSPLAGPSRRDRVLVAAPLRAHRGFRALRSALAGHDGPVAAQVWAQSWLPDWRPERDYRDSYSARPDEGGVLRDLVHEIDYVQVLFGAPYSLSAVLASAGPLEIRAEQAADLLWCTPRATVAMRLDYVTRPTRRGITVTGADGWLTWDVQAATLRTTRSDGTVAVVTFAEDLQRDQVMAVQARAALDLDPAGDPEALIEAGAPATFAQAVAAVAVCDQARQADLSLGASS